jgi:hypothetical protein
VAAAARDALAASLGDPDPAVRGHAALALATATGAGAASSLARDHAPLRVFDPRTGRFRETSVGAAASGGDL